MRPGTRSSTVSLPPFRRRGRRGSAAAKKKKRTPLLRDLFRPDDDSTLECGHAMCEGADWPFFQGQTVTRFRPASSSPRGPRVDRASLHVETAPYPSRTVRFGDATDEHAARHAAAAQRPSLPPRGLRPHAMRRFAASIIKRSPVFTKADGSSFHRFWCDMTNTKAVRALKISIRQKRHRSQINQHRPTPTSA